MASSRVVIAVDLVPTEPWLQPMVRVVVVTALLMRAPVTLAA